MITLATELSRIRGLSENFLSKLAKLNIVTVRDLLWHFPHRYEDFSQIVNISDLAPNQSTTVRGTIKKVDLRRTWRRKMMLVEAIIADESGGIKAVWFNQPYVAKILKVGMQANFAGKVLSGSGGIYLSNPAYEPLRGNTATIHTAGLIPVYPETKGLTSRGIRYLVKPVLQVLSPIPDFIPQETLAKHNLPELYEALKSIHFPNRLREAEEARRRFAFEDLFLLQLNNLNLRMKLAREKAPRIAVLPEELAGVLAVLPFALTESQKRSLDEIMRDLAAGRPMNRLLQGDVGSGKTVVVAVAALVAAKNGIQAAFMAPTEVLARQHYHTIHSIFGALLDRWGITIGLLIAGIDAKSKKKVVSGIARGEAQIVIGTHALLQKGVTFHNLGLIVVDEQHRFGVQQRRRLTQINAQIDADNDRINELAAHIDSDNAPLAADSEDGGFLYEDLTYQIRGALFEVANTLGLGLKEIIYQKSLQEEFTKRRIAFEKEKSLPVVYNGKSVGVYRPDFIVEGKIILEIKALPFIGKIEESQLWSYLKGADYKLAILANFGKEKLDIKKLVYDQARDRLRKPAPSLRPSAPHPRESALMPHFLSMSATPIPRTLSLTLFGDLDLSIIDELPSGRKKIITKIVAPENRRKAYDFVRGEIKKGRQAFVICPRIDSGTQTIADNTQINADLRTSASHLRESAFSNLRPSASHLRESASLEVKAVKEEYEKLSQKIFPDLRVALIHGKLASKEKEAVMGAFKSGKTDILVATSLIEVGVDVPNAAIMMIEGAEHFGLAQLYQFRGRIGRGEHQSYCLLFAESGSQSVRARLHALLAAKNGFELAELDLRLRGPGEFLGEKQTGLPDLAMKALNNMELVRAARASASDLLSADPDLQAHPLLSEKFASFRKQIHLE